MDRFTRQPASGDAPKPAAPATGAPAKSTVTGAFSQPTTASKFLVLSLILASLAVTLALAISAYSGLTRGSRSLVKSDQYQAVFLDNGQVYFGKLSDVNANYVRLTDIYYLQVEQQVQPVTEDDSNESEEQAQPNISLAKLGNELHGPEDEMFIHRDKVVFWENLKNDGQVVEAITAFLNGETDSNVSQ